MAWQLRRLQTGSKREPGHWALDGAMQGSRAQSGAMGNPPEWGQRLNCGPEFLHLGFLLGLIKARVDFSHRRTDREETLGTWGSLLFLIQKISPLHLTLSYVGP